MGSVEPIVGSVEPMSSVKQGMRFRNASLSSNKPNLQMILMSKNGRIHQIKGMFSLKNKFLNIMCFGLDKTSIILETVWKNCSMEKSFGTTAAAEQTFSAKIY